MEMTCIVCPNSCQLTVVRQKTDIAVTGNRCPRGAQFARTELTCPMRTISTTVKTVFDDVPALPVRTSTEIPKAAIFDVINEIRKTTVTQRLKTGDAVIKNVRGLGADIIVTSDLLNDASKEELK